MIFWQRLLVTIVVMLAASFVAQLIWHVSFETDIPGYFAGLVGGLTAIPVWEILGRIKTKQRPLE